MSSKKYDQRYFARWTAVGVVDKEATRRAAQLAVATAQFVVGHAIRTVVDVGCGEGLWRDAIKTTVYYQDVIAARKLRYVAVDPSEYICKTQPSSPT